MTSRPSDEDDAAGRRAKKRELDRRAQRAARERNRNRIAQLEATIEAMKMEDFGDKASRLLEELSQVKKERDNLVDTLRSITELTGRHLTPGKPPTGNPPASTHTPLRDQQTAIDPEFDCTALASQLMDIEPVMNSLLNVEPLAAAGSATEHAGGRITDACGADITEDVLFDVSSVSVPTISDGLIVPQPVAVCDCFLPPAIPDAGYAAESPNAVGTSIWRRVNKVLALQQPLSRSVLQLEDELAEDFPIRAILEGWRTFNPDDVSPLWQRLYQTDWLQFQGCRDVERLAILILMHRLLRHRADQTMQHSANLPLWLQSRPSQMLPHSPAIDFFVWPGVRERFVFSQHRYCSNQFWKIFAESFRISWPFEFRDCYKKHAMTGRYCLSPDFENCLQDISSWTMRGDFFYYFPEFSVDISRSPETPHLLLQLCAEDNDQSRSHEQSLD